MAHQLLKQLEKSQLEVVTNKNGHPVVRIETCRDEIDLSAIGCSQTKMRGEETEFVTPIRQNLMTLMTATTNKEKLNVWVYMEVFPPMAWATFFAFLLGTIHKRRQQRGAQIGRKGGCVDSY